MKSRKLIIILLFGCFLLSGCADDTALQETSAGTSNEKDSSQQAPDNSKPEGAPGYDPDAPIEITPAVSIPPFPSANFFPKGETVEINGLEFMVENATISYDLGEFTGAGVGDVPIESLRRNVNDDYSYLFVRVTITNPAEQDYTFYLNGIRAYIIEGNQLQNDAGPQNAGISFMDYNSKNGQNSDGHDYFVQTIEARESRDYELVFYVLPEDSENVYMTFDPEGSGNLDSTTLFISISPDEK